MRFEQHPARGPESAPFATGLGHRVGQQRLGPGVPPPVPNEQLVGVDVRGMHSLALRADGSVVAWSDNTCGQRAVPEVAFPAVAIAGGYDHGLALKADGSLIAWGMDPYGDFHNVPGPSDKFIVVAAGGYHGLATRPSRSVACLGINTHGQCDVPDPKRSFVAVAGGDTHSMGLRADGNIACWGENSQGQCNVAVQYTGFVGIPTGPPEVSRIVGRGGRNILPLKDVVMAVGAKHGLACQIVVTDRPK